MSGHPEWTTKPEWSTQKGRSADRKAINAAIGEVTKTMPSDHWIELFENAGVPCGPINTIDKVFADPQVKHLGMAVPMAHPRLGTKDVVASAINISGHRRDIRIATRDLAADTDAILAEAGLSADDIATLRSKKAIV